jgi:hypothetical protein
MNDDAGHDHLWRKGLARFLQNIIADLLKPKRTARDNHEFAPLNFERRRLATESSESFQLHDWPPVTDLIAASRAARYAFESVPIQV